MKMPYFVIVVCVLSISFVLYLLGPLDTLPNMDNLFLNQFVRLLLLIMLTGSSFMLVHSISFITQSKGGGKR